MSLTSPATGRRLNLNLVELAANAAALLARPPGHPTARAPRGRVGRWADGVTLVRGHRATFAAYWKDANEQGPSTAEGQPLWVVLGDSTAQGLGAPAPDGGYVGQVRTALTVGGGRPWRVVNLSHSGATVGEVLSMQIPALAALGVEPDLVTCGVGSNDVLRTPLPQLRRALRDLTAVLPDGALLLDLPVPSRLLRGYVLRINKVIARAARDHQLHLVEVSRHFTAPWAGKFGPDHFHPSATGYGHWADAILEVIEQRDASRSEQL